MAKDNPYISSATAALGPRPVTRFAIRYNDLKPHYVEARGGCSTTAQPSADLGKALMHVMPSSIRIDIERRYPGLEQAIGWRAQRRLLQAVQSMPSQTLERDEIRAAMVKALLSE